MPVFKQNIPTGRSSVVRKPSAPIYDVNAMRQQQGNGDNLRRLIERQKPEMDRLKKEAEYANSTRGLIANSLKAAPQAFWDITGGNIARLAGSAVQAPLDVANDKFSDKNMNWMKYLGLTPTKTFQHDIGKTRDEIISGVKDEKGNTKGLGSLAWDVAQVPLAGLDALGATKGLTAGYRAYKGASGAWQGLKAAAPEIIDGFLPTTRGINGNSKTNISGNRRLAALQQTKQFQQGDRGYIPSTKGDFQSRSYSGLQGVDSVVPETSSYSGITNTELEKLQEIDRMNRSLDYRKNASIKRNIDNPVVPGQTSLVPIRNEVSQIASKFDNYDQFRTAIQSDQSLYNKVSNAVENEDQLKKLFNESKRNTRYENGLDNANAKLDILNDRRIKQDIKSIPYRKVRVTGGEGTENGVQILNHNFATRINNAGKEINIRDREGKLVDGSIEDAINNALTNGKDKARINLHNQTPIRNIEDIFGEHAPEVKSMLTDEVAKNETVRSKWFDREVAEITDNFKKNGLKLKNEADKLAFRYAERRISLEELKKVAPDNWKNIVDAAEFGKAKYEEYLTAINQKLSQYGYPEIPKRADYVTHTNELSVLDNILGGITNISKDKLPAIMNMIHLQTKPGKEFFKYGLKRKGGAFEESLINAMDAYLTPASNQIFHTDTAQKARLFEKVFQEQLNKNPDTQQLSNFSAWMTDYVNGLTGKGSDLDRSVEKLVGRQLPNAINWLRGRSSANMVGGNISSALTNFIPLTQSFATTNKIAAGKGLVESFVTPFSKTANLVDGVESAFLTRRFGGASRIKMDWQEKTKKTAGWIFQAVDKLVSHSIVSGKYYEGIENGLNPKIAMQVADDYAARIMADRSKGQMPTLYNSKTAGLITQFQLEVNNQLSFMFKDIPKMSQGNKLKLASMLGQVFLYGNIYNNIIEKATGRRPAFDPIGIVFQGYKDFSNDNENKWKNLGQNISNQLPYASTFTGGGRIPLSAAAPDIEKLSDGDIYGGLRGPVSNLLLPTGGGQLKKTYEGIQAYNDGAVRNPSGNVQFPIEQDIPNMLRTSLFGKYAVPESNEYFDNNGRPLSEEQSKIFDAMGPEYYDKLMQMRIAEDRQKEIRDQMESEIKTAITAGKYDKIAEIIREDPEYGKTLFKKLTKETNIENMSDKDKKMYYDIQTKIQESKLVPYFK